MSRALVIVDVQNDFCEGGALAVAGGSDVAVAITDFLDQRAADYAHVVATADNHIDPGGHFAEEPDFVRSWPPHCVAGTAGAEFHAALDTAHVEAVFTKGEYSDGYSGFEGAAAEGDQLADWLRSHGVDSVDVVGVATDHCVRATALDAAGAGFATRVLLDLTAGVARDTTDRAVAELRDGGVELAGTPVVRR